MPCSERSWILIITHYQRLLNYITPDVVHIMMKGAMVMTGDAELAKRLEAEGYKGVSVKVILHYDEKSLGDSMTSKHYLEPNAGFGYFCRCQTGSD